jgi:16S rRNA (guanine527-N7)-methyltransferase
MIKGWEYLKDTASKYELGLQEKQLDQFAAYLQLLQEWNKKINLTAIDDEAGIIIKHFIDSLLFLKKIGIKDGVTVLDLGTGAGFPGVPLKIWQPDVKIVLVDSLQKRINFLRNVVETLDLAEVELIHGRAEDLAQKYNYREKFDLCISRAVANLAVLTEYCLPFVKKGGYFAAAKGPDLDNELKDANKAITVLGGQIDELEYYTLPYLNENRSFVKIIKTAETPQKYPRKAGIPAKKPL